MSSPCRLLSNHGVPLLFGTLICLCPASARSRQSAPTAEVNQKVRHWYATQALSTSLALAPPADPSPSQENLADGVSLQQSSWWTNTRLPAFDTASLFVRHAPNYLPCRLPRQWGFATVGGDSTSRFDWCHVGGIYIPGGFQGYTRWMAGTPIDSTEHEVPCLRVSNDGLNWTVFSNGTGECRDPLFTRDSCKHKNARATYLSDTDLLMGRDGKIWIIWRATHDTPDTTYHSLWVTSTGDGIRWSPATNILGWWPEPVGGARLSPAWWVDRTGNYRMWVVQQHPTNPDSNYIELWQAPRPDSGWALVDTVRKVGSTDNWVGQGDISVGGAWHVEVVDYNGPQKIVLLVNRYTASHIYRRLYIGLTPDDGQSLDMRYAPLVMPSDTTAAASPSTLWDSRLIYRSTAYWVTEGSDSSLELVYIGNTPSLPGTGGYAGHWRMGLSRINSATRIIVGADSVAVRPDDNGSLPIRILNTQDSIAGFAIELRTNHPGLIQFDTRVDTAGTLVSGWEAFRESTLTADGSVLRVLAKAERFPTPGGPYIPPGDLPRELFRVNFKAARVPDTLSDRTVRVAFSTRTRWIDYGYLPGDTVGAHYHYTYDTVCYQCQQWSGTDCLNWQIATGSPCDSSVVLQDSTLEYDSTITVCEDGAVTLLACSYAPAPADIDNDGVSFTAADRAELLRYVSGTTTQLAEPRNADLDGDCTIGWADLYALDRYIKWGPDSLHVPACICSEPMWNCCWGMRGNLNNDPGHLIDLSDLSALVTYLTDGRRPICVAEANVNGIGNVDISDLSLLIAYLVLPTPPLIPACP